MRSTVSRDATSGLAAVKNTRKSTLAPVRRCPPELLSEIFLYCLPNSRERKPRRVDNAPLLLGQICSHWRRVAISTARLWTSMSFGDLLRVLTSEANLAKVWLARAGQYPLSINLRMVKETAFVFRPAIDLLLPTCERWQHLDMVLPISALVHFDTIKGRLPQLQSLSLRQLPLEEPFYSRTRDVFEVAPQLHSLCIDHTSARLLSFPWHQLTTLCLRSFLFDECRGVLPKCPNLKRCEIHFDFNPYTFICRMSTPFTHMKSLQLKSSSILSGPLNFFVLPALCDFQIVSEGSANGIGPPLVALFVRSRCPLQRLCLDFRNYSFDCIDLVECLESVPTLIQLELRRKAAGVLTCVALDRLTEDSPASCLVPKLQVLILDAWLQLRDSYFSRMVQSRWWPGDASQVTLPDGTVLARLVTVEFNCYRRIHPMTSTLEFLHQAQNEGLDVRLNINN
jgi:hypothetical protein